MTMGEGAKLEKQRCLALRVKGAILTLSKDFFLIPHLTILCEMRIVYNVGIKEAGCNKIVVGIATCGLAFLQVTQELAQLQLTFEIPRILTCQLVGTLVSTYS